MTSARAVRWQIPLLSSLAVVICLSACGGAGSGPQTLAASAGASSIASPGPTEPASAAASPDASSSADPNACGSWSADSSATGAAISKQYGEIRNCFHVDKYWVVTTLASSSGPGAVGVYECTDAACNDGAADHPVSGFRFYRGARAGGVTLLNVSGDDVVVDVDGVQRTFSLTSRTFS